MPCKLDPNQLASCWPFSVWIYINNLIKESDWLTIRSGGDILIYSAWQWLIYYCRAHSHSEGEQIHVQTLTCTREPRQTWSGAKTAILVCCWKLFSKAIQIFYSTNTMYYNASKSEEYCTVSSNMSAQPCIMFMMHIVQYNINYFVAKGLFFSTSQIHHAWSVLKNVQTSISLIKIWAFWIYEEKKILSTKAQV